MVAYADLVLPDTTYLERWDCISLLDRPISSPTARPTRSASRWCEPDRDVRPFQDVLLDLGARLGLAGIASTRMASPRYPGGYADYIVNHERRPGIGPLAGWRGADGSEYGRGEPNPDQLQRYIDNGCFWQDELAPGPALLQARQRAYLEYARAHGLHGKPTPMTFQLYCEPLQKFRLAAQGARRRLQPPRRPSGAHRDLFRSAAVLRDLERQREHQPQRDRPPRPDEQRIGSEGLTVLMGAGQRPHWSHPAGQTKNI